MTACKIPLLMGPTASGKTALSLRLAESIPLEIISVDSALVYRGMDIGTAKPDPELRERVPHHLIDILDPADIYSAARFREDALRLISQILARQRLPLLVGGTMLYFKALTDGLNELPQADAALRQKITHEAERIGWPEMHALLAQRDPITAARLHPNDRQRIQRALEVVELSGSPLSQLQQSTVETPYGWLKIALSPPSRDDVHRMIEKRFDQMLDSGLINEVQNLYQRGDLHPGLPAIRAVGYRQVWGFLDGEYDLTSARERGIAATRQFAKRQFTWLRKVPDLHWVNAFDSGAISDVLKLINRS